MERGAQSKFANLWCETGHRSAPPATHTQYLSPPATTRGRRGAVISAAAWQSQFRLTSPALAKECASWTVTSQPLFYFQHCGSPAWGFSPKKTRTSAQKVPRPMSRDVQPDNFPKSRDRRPNTRPPSRPVKGVEAWPISCFPRAISVGPAVSTGLAHIDSTPFAACLAPLALLVPFQLAHPTLPTLNPTHPSRRAAHEGGLDLGDSEFLLDMNNNNTANDAMALGLDEVIDAVADAADVLNVPAAPSERSGCAGEAHVGTSAGRPRLTGAAAESAQQRAAYVASRRKGGLLVPTNTTTHQHHHPPVPPPTNATTHQCHHPPIPPPTSTTTHQYHHPPIPPPTNTTTHQHHHPPIPPPTNTTTHQHHHPYTNRVVASPALVEWPHPHVEWSHPHVSGRIPYTNRVVPSPCRVVPSPCRVVASPVEWSHSLC